VIETFFATLAGTSIAGAVVAFLARTLIETRVKESVRHECDKKLEEFKFDVRKREQSALVAALF
jgi:uncharacterized membrane protein YdjX (TVP38/TMEM64 family)